MAFEQASQALQGARRGGGDATTASLLGLQQTVGRAPNLARPPVDPGLVGAAQATAGAVSDAGRSIGQAFSDVGRAKGERKMMKDQQAFLAAEAEKSRTHDAEQARLERAARAEDERRRNEMLLSQYRESLRFQQLSADAQLLAPDLAEKRKLKQAELDEMSLWLSAPETAPDWFLDLDAKGRMNVIVSKTSELAKADADYVNNFRRIFSSDQSASAPATAAQQRGFEGGIPVFRAGEMGPPSPVSVDISGEQPTAPSGVPSGVPSGTPPLLTRNLSSTWNSIPAEEQLQSAAKASVGALAVGRSFVDALNAAETPVAKARAVKQILKSMDTIQQKIGLSEDKANVLLQRLGFELKPKTVTSADGVSQVVGVEPDYAGRVALMQKEISTFLIDNAGVMSISPDRFAMSLFSVLNDNEVSGMMTRELAALDAGDLRKQSTASMMGKGKGKLLKGDYSQEQYSAARTLANTISRSAQEMLTDLNKPEGGIFGNRIREEDRGVIEKVLISLARHSSEMQYKVSAAGGNQLDVALKQSRDLLQLVNSGILASQGATAERDMYSRIADNLVNAIRTEMMNDPTLKSFFTNPGGLQTANDKWNTGVSRSSGTLLDLVNDLDDLDEIELPSRDDLVFSNTFSTGGTTIPKLPEGPGLAEEAEAVVEEGLESQTYNYGRR